MTEDETKRLTELLSEYLGEYIEGECYDHNWEGFQSTTDRLYEQFVGILEDDNDWVEDILARCDIEINDENKQILFDLLNGGIKW